MASTPQEFDALDGLVITGQLDTGGLTASANVIVDTNVLYVDTVNNRVGINKVPTVAFDVNGNVNIDGGTIDGLTQLSVDSLTLNNQTVESSGLLILKSGSTNAIDLDSGAGAVRLEKGSTEYARFSESATSLVIAVGSSTTTALTLQADGDAVFAANVAMSDGKKIDFGSAMDITASATGATFSANTYHNGHIVHSGDTNTYMQFHAADQWRVVTGGSQRLEVNNTQVTINNVPLVVSGQDITGKVLHATDYFEENVYDGGSGTAYTMNINNGSVHKFQPTGNYSIDFSNFPTSGAATFTLIINNNGTGREPTWPASGEGDKIYWSEGQEPPHSTGVDIYSFYVVDGQIYGSLGIRNAGFAN